MKRILSTIAPLFLLLLASSPVQSQEAPWAWTPSTLELHGNEITFEWAVPKLVRAPGDAAHWQKLLDRRMRDRMGEFQTAFEEARREDAVLLRENPDYKPNPWESSGGYRVVWQDPQQLVLLWHGYDYRGGAHGLPVYEVTVLSSGQPDDLLPPQALFQDVPELLPTLSEAARAALASQSPEPLDEWALKGSAPAWENYSVIYPSFENGRRRFEVIFPPYQVAPYAAGAPTVEVPWEVLAPFTPGLTEGVPLP